MIYTAQELLEDLLSLKQNRDLRDIKIGFDIYSDKYNYDIFETYMDFSDNENRLTFNLLLSDDTNCIREGGHIWKAPDFSTCELCEGDGRYTDKFCSKNPNVSKEYENWRNEQKELNKEENFTIMNGGQ